MIMVTIKMKTSDFDTFTEESTEFGNCDTVLRKVKKI